MSLAPALVRRACTGEPDPELAVSDLSIEVGVGYVDDYDQGFYALATLDSYNGTTSGAATVSEDGKTFNISIAHDAFKGRDWRCYEGSATGGGKQTYDDIEPVYFSGFTPTPWPPEPCNRGAANDLKASTMVPWMRRQDGKFFGGVPATWWGVARVVCSDLTGDGQPEMVVQLTCCTGGTPTPWAIFTHDGDGDWHLVYGKVHDNAWRLRASGWTLRLRRIARYEGPCTHIVRDRVVTWTGQRFASRQTKS